MRFGSALQPARVVDLVNRFTVCVALDGGEREPAAAGAYLANTGNLRSILTPGARVMVTPAPRPGGKLAYHLVLARQWGRWVAVDSSLPARLLAEAIAGGHLEAFAGWEVERREPAVEDGRLDLLLRCGERRMWVEAKCTTLVRNGIARFPDPATERGRRHLERLIALVHAGEEAAVCFVAQRGDAAAYRTLHTVDPGFAEALARAREAGVRCHAYRCRVSLRGISIAGEIPVLDPLLG